jgi:hypothetical protein
MCVENERINLKDVEIKVMGEEAIIESLFVPNRPDEICIASIPFPVEWYPYPRGALGAWIKLKKPIKGVKNFPIWFPAKDYSREKLIKVITKEAEKELKKHLREKEQEELREKKEKELEKLASKLRHKLVL